MDEDEVSTPKPYDWREDPIILDRLEMISRLQIAGDTNKEICFKLGTTPARLKEDIKRLTVMRKESVESAELFALRQQSVEIMRAVEREAWRRLNAVALESKTGADLLAQITAAEREVMRLQGTPATQDRGEDYDPSVNIQIINGITERIHKVATSRGTQKLLTKAEPTGIIDAEVSLATMGETKPTTS